MKRKPSARAALFFVTYLAATLVSVTVFDGLLSFGLFVGALYATNPVLACVVYGASSVVCGWGGLAQASVRLGGVMLFWTLHRLLGKKIGKIQLFFYMVAANLYYLATDFSDYGGLAVKLLYVACGILFAYVCIYVFRAVFVRGVNYRPALDERICIAAFVVAMAFCLSKNRPWGLDPTYFVAPFAILFCVSTLSDKHAYICAALIGIGSMLATGTPECCAFCVFAAVAATSLSKINRFVGALAVVSADVILSYYFNIHGQFSTIVFVPTAVSVLVFVVVPSSVYAYLRDCFYGDADKYLSQSVSRKLGVALSRRLYRLSDIFLSMKNAFYSVSSGRVSVDEAEKAIVRSVSDNVCRVCHLRAECWRKQGEATEQNVLLLAKCAVKRGKCTILDVPQAFTGTCERVSAVIAEINVQARAYAEYVNRVEQADSSKLLLGEQMGGVSGLLLQLASDCKDKAVTDDKREGELVDALVFHNVMCVGATVMRQAETLSVFVTVRQNDVATEVIERVVTQVIGQKMEVERVEETESPYWANVALRAKPQLQVQFGIAAARKQGSELSGDTHTVLKTDNGKCIIALCDGMGSGSKAEQLSATSISLVESFYRAGFDNDVILSCVNRLLTGCGNEVFCAVDMVVLDLYNGLADFIKLGAPNGLVKCGDEVELVSGGSLPLGVLEEMKPSVTKKALSKGDGIVLFTDGILDCVQDIGVIADAFKKCQLSNPQSIAEDILSRAVKQCNGKPADDMTVLVARLA